MSARVLCVANRLPVTLTRVSSPANYTYKKSSGGLVSALKAVRGLAMVWIGWVGTEIEHAHQDMVLETCVNEYGCRPVFLTEEESMEYYDGYCNNVLWPLFHYITPPIDYTSRPSLEKNYKQFDFYRKVNMKFAAAVARCYRPGDIIWIHDYHLCILPSLLRNLFPDAIIGWFLHTSFPDNKVFRQLSTREEILEGLLGASLLGFHTYDYVRHFQDACHSVLGLEKVTDGVLSHTYGHVRCAAIPIGIDPSPFVEKCVEPQVAKLVQVMNRSLGFKRIILGVDRLDYMKGIPQKLCAFDRMLEMHPELANEVTLVQLAVPSRESVPEYKRLKSSVQQLVSSINGQKTSLTRSSVPVVFLNQSLNFEELCALYSLSEVCFITSIRDGMNLVAYEYVVCQENKHGVLLLSEFAGAAQYLAGGMTPINPWDVEGTAEALYEALKLPEAERRAMHELAIKAIYSQTAEM
ncbi:MAG: uncharacterized protein KVP18_001010 [Porospora cf. gigantea A]|uniref:uncharacterized protein n=1 Tax=Porospora cf. gigantea A TaxID=2853593 RepID=UPI00355A4A98|nr:MAG: hypothetical protein KVP18_001010 [Porospora cf. gigantea A]